MSIPFTQLSFPELYERALVTPLFRPFVDATLEAVGIGPNDRVLDIACGTGIAGRAAQQRAGDGVRVVGIDVSPPMLALGREVAPAIDFREGDAAALPLHANEQFDVVICHQGMQFFPDRVAAAREMHRALAPGGRVAVATWRSDADYAFLFALRLVAEGHVGPINDRRHSLSDATDLEACLATAGFRDVSVRTVTRTVRFEDPMLFVRLNAMALIGMSAAGKDMNEEERTAAMAAIIRDSEAVVRKQAGAGSLAYEIGMNLALARRS